MTKEELKIIVDFICKKFNIPVETCIDNKGYLTQFGGIITTLFLYQYSVSVIKTLKSAI